MIIHHNMEYPRKKNTHDIMVYLVVVCLHLLLFDVNCRKVSGHCFFFSRSKWMAVLWTCWRILFNFAIAIHDGRGCMATFNSSIQARRLLFFIRLCCHFQCNDIFVATLRINLACLYCTMWKNNHSVINNNTNILDIVSNDADTDVPEQQQQQQANSTKLHKHQWW